MEENNNDTDGDVNDLSDALEDATRINVKFQIDNVVDEDSKLDYLGGQVSPGGAVNILTNIIRTLSDKKGSSSNRGVIQRFIMERDAFKVDLPKT